MTNFQKVHTIKLLREMIYQSVMIMKLETNLRFHQKKNKLSNLLRKYLKLGFFLIKNTRMQANKAFLNLFRKHNWRKNRLDDGCIIKDTEHKLIKEKVSMK
jgi:hypothetical protein